jgi:hypothetical protein
MRHHPLASCMVVLTIGLGGCSAPSDPMSLIPANVQATIASDRAREQQQSRREPAGGIATGERSADGSNSASGEAAATALPASLNQKQARDAPQAGGQPMETVASASGQGAKPTLQVMLTRARSAPPPPPVQAGSAQGGPFVPAPTDPSADSAAPRAAAAPATSIAAGTTVTPPPTQLLGVPRASATQKMPLDPGLKITFASGAKTLSTFEESRLTSAAANARLAPGARVTLILGPASSSSSWERLSLARRRGEAIATLLPHGLEIVQDYKPELPPDAVWVVFGARSVTEFVSQ